jgi:gas vesicle protein
MRYEKLISKYLKRSNSTDVAVAVVAGLAVGAVISILFAPSTGYGTRTSLANKAKDLGNSLRDSYSSLRDRIVGASEAEEPVAQEMPHFIHKSHKKPKSDIKELLNEAHQHEKPHTEQSIS